MVPQEKQSNIESAQIKEVAKENNSLKEKLQKIFESSTLKTETIENLKKILALVDINELDDFIIGEPDLDDAINKGLDIDISLSLEGIIDNFLMKFGERKNSEGVKKEGKKIFTEQPVLVNEIESTEKGKKEATNEENQSIDNALKTLESKKEEFKKIFGENSDFFQLFEKYKDDELKTELIKFLSNKNNAKEFFQTLNDKNPALYKETYNAVITISPELKNNFTAWGIPSEPYKEVEKISGGKIPPEIVAQLPGATPQDIEKRGNLVSYGDKTIDIETGKAYISGEGGYAIETSMKVPNSLDLRVKYQKERLEIIDEIKTNEKILHLLENKETLKQKLETLKNNKSTQEKSAQDLQIDIEINAIETEIKKINEKLKTIVPGYKEDQDEAFKRFLEQKIEKSKESLKSLKEKFDEDMKKLLQAGQDEIAARDQKIRETISFLDDLGITNINQNDLQKIIDRINIHPHTYGFSKKIDLKNGFDKSPTDALKQKNEFFNLFSKIYEKMNFDPPVKQSIVEGFTKDERLKNDTTFKQKLEDIGVTKGGSVQIETMMSILGEKPEEKERERVYNGKPTQNEKVSETIQTK